jgi:hypothetical protein
MRSHNGSNDTTLDPLFRHFTIPLLTFVQTLKSPGSEIVYLEFVLDG